MSWINDNIDKIKTEGGALDKFIRTGSLGEVGFSTKSLIMLGLSILTAGCLLMLFYKYAVQKN